MQQEGRVIARTFRLPADVVKALDEHYEKTGASRTFVVAKAVREYLDRHGSDLDEYDYRRKHT